MIKLSTEVYNLDLFTINLDFGDLFIKVVRIMTLSRSNPGNKRKAIFEKKEGKRILLIIFMIES